MTPQVLWLYGADAVGKSAVGWETYAILAQAARTRRVTAQRGSRWPTWTPTTWASARRHRRTRPLWVARNLAAVWSGFAAAGARRLVVSGIAVTAEDKERFERAIPGRGSPSAG